MDTRKEGERQIGRERESGRERERETERERERERYPVACQRYHL
jgi:hypothetical protein